MFGKEKEAPRKKLSPTAELLMVMKALYSLQCAEFDSKFGSGAHLNVPQVPVTR